jgi:hypothetical protein
MVFIILSLVNTKIRYSIEILAYQTASRVPEIVAPAKAGFIRCVPTATATQSLSSVGYKRACDFVLIATQSLCSV